MKTIVHVITSLGQGGAEKQLLNLVKHHDSSQYKMIVVSLQDEGALGVEMKSYGIMVYSFNIKRKRMVWFALWKLIKLLRDLKPDLIQTWLYHANILGLLASQYLKNAIVVWNIRCSNMLIGSHSWILVAIVKIGAILSRFPDAIVVNSNSGLSAHQALGYHSKKWQLIPNGFDTDLYRPDKQARLRIRNELNVLNSTLLVGFIARFDPVKDCNTFFEAMSLVMQKTSNIYCVLVGSGMEWSNQTLIKSIEHYNFKDRLFLLGSINKMATFLPGLDLVVLSSISEGCPNVLGEAMSSGVLCVSTDVGDSAMLVNNSERIVSPGHAQDLAKAIEKVLNIEESVRLELGLLERKRMIDHFSISKLTSSYEKLYQDLFFEKQMRGQ